MHFKDSLTKSKLESGENSRTSTSVSAHTGHDTLNFETLLPEWKGIHSVALSEGDTINANKCRDNNDKKTQKKHKKKAAAKL